MMQDLWTPGDEGEFWLRDLRIKTASANFSLWFLSFLVAFLFEVGKLYIATLQRDANRRKFRSRRVEKLEILMKMHLTMVAMGHNIIGFMLMMAVMVYIQLLIPVVLGGMLGYFLFGILLLRINMQCFCGCVPKCLPKCDKAGGDRCYRRTCDVAECTKKTENDDCKPDDSGWPDSCLQYNAGMDEIELRQMDHQPDFLQYEVLNMSHSYTDTRKSVGLYTCAHESLPKLSSNHDSSAQESHKAMSLPRLSFQDLCELHPEYYYTCAEGHLHHYPDFCPHLMKET